MLRGNCGGMTGLRYWAWYVSRCEKRSKMFIDCLQFFSYGPNIVMLVGKRSWSFSNQFPRGNTLIYVRPEIWARQASFTGAYHGPNRS